MSLPSKKDLKTGAKLSLVVLLLFVSKQFVSIYQTQYQLTSPFIPASAILLIIKPAIFSAAVTTGITIAGLLFYFYEKYIWVIALTGLAIAGQEVYPYFL